MAPLPILGLVILSVVYYLVSSLDSRIIGGTFADINTLPYQVSLQDARGHFCGGSVIHKSYILTAAHCLDDVPVRSLRVRAGSSLIKEGGVVRRVCDTTVHSLYRNYDYDIAILKLCKDLVFNENITSVALPRYGEAVKDGTVVVASGWGVTNNKSPFMSPRLQKVFLVTINQSSCRQSYRNLAQISRRMICAGCKAGLCDSCKGDSGGPLVSNNKLIGMVSWGHRCASKEYPGVYTQVAKFRKWIKSKINF